MYKNHSLFFIFKILIILLVSSFSVFYGCSQEQNAGATTETTNGIALFVKDSSDKPLPMAKIAIFDSTFFTPLATSISDSNGFVEFILNDSIKDFFIEAIYGIDSSAMAWEKCSGDSLSIQVLPSVEIKLNFNIQDSIPLPDFVLLKETPYRVFSSESGYVFKRAPQGLFEVITNDHISLGVYDFHQNESLSFSDTILRKTLVLDDFNDGNIQLGFIENSYPINWYFNSSNDAVWYADQNIEWTSSTKEFEHPAQFFTENAYEGVSISLHYSVGDSGMLLLGTHLGIDSVNYDFSNMKAIRLMVRGDGIFNVALETNRAVGENLYPKALWRDTASTEWKEYVFYPGKEIIDIEHKEFAWDDVKQEIGIFSIFINSGSFLEIDNIIIDGLSELIKED